MRYYELKNKQQKEFNNFPMFFAFDDKQFAEGMEKFGLDVKDTDKLFKLPGGGFIKKESSKALSDLINKQNKELKKQMKKEEFMLDAMIYELANHEYCITIDPTETINALDLDMKDKRTGELLHKAINKYMKECDF